MLVSVVQFLLILSLTIAIDFCFADDFEYNEKSALEFLRLSKAAYAKKPEAYLHFFLPKYTLMSVVEMDCEYDAYCSGYVAKSDDTIVVSFRGTNKPLQVAEEIANAVLRPRRVSDIGGWVHPYFFIGHELLWDPLMLTVMSIKNSTNITKIYVTGHSLGGALAALFASKVSFERHFDVNDIYVMTFGEPRVGNKVFAKKYDELVPNTWRVVHHRDVVAHIPPCHLFPWENCSSGTAWYYHHGTEVFYPKKKMRAGKSKFELCRGAPLNEDRNCSNALIGNQMCYSYTVIDSDCIDDHTHYFGTKVSRINGTLLSEYLEDIIASQ